VISGDDAGDQIVESPEVKVSVGKAKAESAPTGEASKSTGCKRKRTVGKPRNLFPSRESEGEGCGRSRDFPQESKASVVDEELGASSRRKSRGLRGRHVDTEWPLKARIHSLVA
jgi:hypothetical protein